MELTDTDKMHALVVAEPSPDDRRRAQEVIAQWALTQEDPTAAAREMLDAFGLLKEV